VIKLSAKTEIIQKQLPRKPINDEKIPKDTKDVKYLRDLHISLKKFLSFPAYALYFYKEDTLNCRIIAMTRDSSVLDLKSTSEAFELSNPTLMLKGRPFYTLIRGVPYSLDLRLSEDRKKLVEVGYTLEDIQVKTHAIYTHLVFQPPRIDIEMMFFVVLLIFVSGLITYLITALSFSS